MWFWQAPTCVLGGLGGSGGGSFLREGTDSRGAARIPYDSMIRARQLGLNRPLNSRNGVKNAKLYHHRERPGPVEYRPRLLRAEKLG